MHFLPVFLNLKGGTVALVGAGPAALNKLRLLLSAGAKVRWFSNNADVAEEAGAYVGSYRSSTGSAAR